MSSIVLALLILLFLVTSVIGVVTGSNSLIAVPVMFQVGVDEKVAVATNMFGLVFMAVGGAIPFLRKGAVDVRALSPMILLTIVGSAIGAAIVGYISNDTIKIIVTAAMFAIVIFTLLGGGRGSKDGGATAGGTDLKKELSTKVHENTPNFKELSPFSGISRWFADKNSLGVATKTSGGFLRIAGYLLVFLLAIYGGLYSGGYVTVLTASLVAFFGFNYAGSIAATKVINIFSSSVATAVFIYQGLVDFKLGVILGVTMFVGAYIGAHFASKMNEVWLRRIFLTAVVLLAVKTIYDLFLTA